MGKRGERVAARWLRRRGYRILETNLSFGRDEADLLALAPDGSVVIVEVKTRSNPATWPEMAIDRHKRRRMARIAARLRVRPDYAARAIRFDVVAVSWPPGDLPQVRHFPHAFEVP